MTREDRKGELEGGVVLRTAQMKSVVKERRRKVIKRVYVETLAF